jgi:hypothetical protein
VTQPFEITHNGGQAIDATHPIDVLDTAAVSALGTDTGTPPSTGTGVRGWLRGIYDRLGNPLAVTGAFWQATQPVSGTVVVSSTPAPPHLSYSTDSVTVVQSGSVTSDVSDRAARLVGHVTVDSAPTTAVTGAFWQATQPVSGPATDAQMRATPIPVSGSFSTTVSDNRVLTERMLAKAPATGYHLWLDPADLVYTYIAEAVDGTASSAAAFRGIRISNATAGPVATATAFVWDNRAATTWTS